jgi:hypothetical protein
VGLTDAGEAYFREQIAHALQESRLARAQESKKVAAVLRQLGQQSDAAAVLQKQLNDVIANQLRTYSTGIDYHEPENDGGTMARRRGPLHGFSPVLDVNGIEVDLCRVCNGPKANRAHQAPAAKSKPKGVAGFAVGTRVTWTPKAMGGRTPVPLLGTIVGEDRAFDGLIEDYTVQQDGPVKGGLMTPGELVQVKPADLHTVVAPPKFRTPEEADAWLEAQAVERERAAPGRTGSRTAGCQICGDPDDHGGVAHPGRPGDPGYAGASSYAPGAVALGGAGNIQRIPIAPFTLNDGDSLTITTELTI